MNAMSKNPSWSRSSPYLVSKNIRCNWRQRDAIASGALLEALTPRLRAGRVQGSLIDLVIPLAAALYASIVIIYHTLIDPCL
jgi:hypothetical protein